MLKRIERAETLHADDFATDVLRELEAHRHLAAARKWAVLAEEYDVEHLLVGIVGNFELHFLIS